MWSCLNAQILIHNFEHILLEEGLQLYENK